MQSLIIPFILINLINVFNLNNIQSQSGIIYGPKAAYKIDSPEKWVLDNKSGLRDGLQCVLYLDGYTWQSSPVIMYAKIASPEFETVKNFFDFAIKEFKKEDPKFVYKLFSKKTVGGKYDATIYDYIGGPYKSYERVAYIQVPNAVCYIVFNSSNKEDFSKYSESILKTIDTFEYKPENISK